MEVVFVAVVGLQQTKAIAHSQSAQFLQHLQEKHTCWASGCCYGLCKHQACANLSSLTLGISIKPSSQVWYSCPGRDHFRKALVARLMPYASQIERMDATQK